MVIVEKQTKAVESQPWRTDNWMGEGWLEVPQALVEMAFAHAPYMDLVLNAAGWIIDIVPTSRPPESVPEVLTNEQITLIIKAMNGGNTSV